MSKMNVLFLSKYGEKAASARHRFYQYMPYLEEHSVHCTVSPLFDDLYLKKKLDLDSPVYHDVLKAFFRRCSAVANARKYDLILVHCEAFPYLPPFFESYFAWSGIKYVYDFDDAIFHQYDQHPNRVLRLAYRNKISSVISRAALVFAGSPYLAQYAKKFNQRVEVLPTVIDLQRYHVRGGPHPGERPFTIGWIGSPSTARQLSSIEPALAEACGDGYSGVTIIGSGKVNLQGFPCELLPWQGQTEVADIQKFDVGIMPLADTPWERGKCGFKLIQYMACGIPVVASPVGVNAEIVEHGVNGFLAGTQQEWAWALKKLRDNPELRREMGQAGRAKVEREYCLQVTAPRMLDLMKGAVGR